MSIFRPSATCSPKAKLLGIPLYRESVGQYSDIQPSVTQTRNNDLWSYSTTGNIRGKEKPSIETIKIQILQHFRLTIPLDALVEPDDDGFIVRAVDLPLFGFGDDKLEAINALKNEIESLYNDLMEDDQFTDEWLRCKEFLKERIVPSI